MDTAYTDSHHYDSSFFRKMEKCLFQLRVLSEVYKNHSLSEIKTNEKPCRFRPFFLHSLVAMPMTTFSIVTKSINCLSHSLEFASI